MNRSHYEDVVTARCIGVDRRAPDAGSRYRHIREFERMLADEGITMVKVFLHISKEEQRARLQARIDDPEKNWKFRRADLDTRAQWDEYQTRTTPRSPPRPRRGRRGTSCPPTTSGCATSRWPRCWSTCSPALDPQIPEPEAGLEGLVVE